MKGIIIMFDWNFVFESGLIGEYNYSQHHDDLLSYEECQEIEDYFNIDDNIDILYQEMKTRDEYSREKFKKKYDYKPNSDDKYKDKGTITVNNKKVPIDMSKSLYEDKNGNPITKKDKNKLKVHDRSTGVSSDNDNTISLDKNFFKLKNQKRRDAMLFHELTHRNWQMPNADKNMQVPELKKFYKDTLIHQYTEIFKKQGYTDKEISDFLSRPDVTNIIDKKVETEYLHNKKYNSKNAERSEAISKLNSKYTSNTNDHINPLEKEADIVASKETSTQTMKQAIRETNKLRKKDILNTEYHKETKPKKEHKYYKYNHDYPNTPKTSEFNKKSSDDYSKRSKSLDDKDFKNIKYYNNIGDKNGNKS